MRPQRIELPIHDRPSLERYSRQMRFPGIGEAGQRSCSTAASRCAAAARSAPCWPTPWSAPASAIVRIVDRDFIETSNLQRQVLFDEHDVAENLPKAEAAARKLGTINSSVTIEPVVTDIDRTNIVELCQDADLILDGTDNFEIRYLINDVAVKLGKPWVYGGAIGSHGQTMTILPGETPCLRCVFEAAPARARPAPARRPACSAPIVSIVASFQAAEAIKILTGQRRRDQPRADHTRRVGEHQPPDQDRRRCWARSSARAASSASSSGSTASTARRRRACAAATPCRWRTAAASSSNFEELARHLGDAGQVSYNTLPAEVQRRDGDYEFTVFPDGRAIIKGTSDVGQGPDAVREVRGPLTPPPNAE